MDIKILKKDEKLIDGLARTDTVRELARVLLAYMTVEQMAQFMATLIFMRAKGGDEEDAIDFFLKDQFFSILRTLTLSFADLLPDMITDVEFMKTVTKLYGERFSLKNLFKMKSKRGERKEIISVSKEE
jgi:hypothetical protein